MSVAEIPVIFKSEASPRINSYDCLPKDVLHGGLSKQNGSKAFAYWQPTNLITCKGYEGSTTFELAGVHGKVHLIDPMDGAIYEIGDDIMKDFGNGLLAFEHLPIKDYPLILTFGEFI